MIYNNNSAYGNKQQLQRRKPNSNAAPATFHIQKRAHLNKSGESCTFFCSKVNPDNKLEEVMLMSKDMDFFNKYSRLYDEAGSAIFYKVLHANANLWKTTEDGKKIYWGESLRFNKENCYNDFLNIDNSGDEDFFE